VLATDEDRAVVTHILRHLNERGVKVERVPTGIWAKVALAAAHAVAEKRVDFAVVCCWTGTGVCIAANKVMGVRAALVVDRETAAGARKWNDANVLALSLRLLSEPVATEILDAWLDNPYGGTEDESLAAIRGEEGTHPPLTGGTP
jgi:ribose 5-phosphate isomerase B